MLSKKQQEEIIKALPGADHVALISDVQDALARYEKERLLSSDCIPGPDKVARVVSKARDHLNAAAMVLIDDEGFQIPGALGAILDDQEEASASFLAQLSALINACDALEKSMGSGRMLVNGKPHARKTRTKTRDTYLIPMLAAIAKVHGGLDIPEDYEDLDAACSFVEATLKAAGVSSPSAGDTRQGEDGQGRLRRQVKESLLTINNAISSR